MSRIQSWGQHALAMACTAVVCAAQAQTINYSVPAGDLKTALEAYIAQSGRQVVYRPEDLRGEKSPGVQGALEHEKALAQLLSGTALAVVKDASGAMLLVRRGSGQGQSGGDTLQAAADGDARQLEQVLVTGTLRKTVLQKTPLSISALSERALKDQGAESLSDFYRKVPGLQVLDRGPNEKKLVIRGIQNDVAAGYNTVGVYIDDLPVSLSGAQLDINLFDVERVEVLRGPQGTLYGASSMTGTIKYITNKPDVDSFDATVQLGLDSTQHGGLSRSADAMINVPLSKGLAALRVVAYKRHSAGFIDRVYPGEAVPAFAGMPADAFFPGSPEVRGHAAYQLDPIQTKNANVYNVAGGRLSAQIRPRPGLVLTASALTEDGKLADRYAHQPDEAGDLKSAVSIRLPAHNRNHLYNMTAEWDLGATSLYASVNQSKRHTLVTEQFTGVFPAELTPPGTELTTELNGSTSSQELRLRSNASGQRLNWLAGLWNYRGNGDMRQTMQVQQTQDLKVVDQSTPSLDEQWAAFGELSFELLPRLTATLGLRHWNIAQRFGPNTVHIDPAIFFLDPKGVQPNAFAYKDKVNTSKFNLAYQASPTLLVYGQVAQGFRPGGFNGNPTNDPKVPAQYKSDSLWNYELGAKGSLLDGALQYNVTLYNIRWADIQNRVFVNGAGFNGNAGKAHSRGLEFGLEARPSDRLELSASGALLDARLDEDAPANPDFPTGVEGKKGDRLPAVPRVTLALGAQYRMPVGAYELVLRADFTHTGRSFTQFRAVPPASPTLQSELNAHNMVNLRSTLRADRWELAAYINNLFDTRPVVDVYKFLSQPTLVTTARPRTFGLRAMYHFE